MARQRDDGEVQIDNSTHGRFQNAFQWLIVIAVLNVGTLLIEDISATKRARGGTVRIHGAVAELQWLG
jgi:hypothetical protein